MPKLPKDDPAVIAMRNKIADLESDKAKLVARLAVQAGSAVVVPTKPREEILAGPHFWQWEGKGELFLGSAAGPHGEPAVYRSGDIVPEEFALGEIEAGGESAKYLVPHEGEAEPHEPTADTSPNARIPRPQAHDRAVTVPAAKAPADPATAPAI